MKAAAASRYRSSGGAADGHREPNSIDNRGVSDAGPVSNRVSLLKYSPALVLLLIVICDFGQLTDPDLWGHIRFGQVMLSEHTAILRDHFSYTAYGNVFWDHEWLNDALMALLYNSFGVVGLKMLKFACAAGTIAMMADALAETGASTTAQLNILIIAAVAMMPQMEFRPQLFTFMFFATILAILARHNFRRSAPLWVIIPMMAIWANLHGGFIIGLASLGTYTAVSGIRDIIRGDGLRRAMLLAGLTALSALATLITPYGLRDWYTIARALHNPVTRLAVKDWQPLLNAISAQWAVGHSGVIYYACGLTLIIGAAIAFSIRPRGNDAPLVAIAAVMSIAAFISVRNLPLAVIACTIPLARRASILTSGLKPVAATTAPRSRPAEAVVAMVAVVMMIYGGLLSSKLRTDMPYPAGAVKFMKENNLHGNLLADFGWGEYLIWHAPESRVFIDGRYDTVFSERVIIDYVTFYFDLPGAERVLSAYPHQFVLLRAQSPAIALMNRSSQWHRVYSDSGSALFAHKSAALAVLPSVNNSAPTVQYFP